MKELALLLMPGVSKMRPMGWIQPMDPLHLAAGLLEGLGIQGWGKQGRAVTEVPAPEPTPLGTRVGDRGLVTATLTPVLLPLVPLLPLTSLPLPGLDLAQEAPGDPSLAQGPK